jgi:hypothetical protein
MTAYQRRVLLHKLSSPPSGLNDRSVASPNSPGVFYSDLGPARDLLGCSLGLCFWVALLWAVL